KRITESFVVQCFNWSYRYPPS
ncbi:hypothetical protein CCACVL1_25812, partial [Corchorus capsularis]